MKPLRFAAALLLVASALATLQDREYDLIWKPKKDDVLDYAMTMEMTVEEMAAKFTSEMRLKVLNVEENGDYEVETTVKNTKAHIDGEEEALEDEEPKIEKYNAKGEKISKDDEEEEELNPISSALGAIADAISTKPVKKGDKWVKEIEPDKDSDRSPVKVEYEFDAEEKVGRWDTIRLKFTYKETEGSEPTTGEGAFWIEANNFALVKLEANLKDVALGEELPKGNVKISIVRE